MPANAPSYDQDNIFARLLRDELPCYRVYEDAHTLAFLDIMPRAMGHTLVIPKSPARNLLDVAPDDLGRTMICAQTIARAAIIAFNADGITLQQASEEAGGQMVPHLHVHVIPRHHGVAMKPPARYNEEEGVLKANAQKLRQALAGLG